MALGATAIVTVVAIVRIARDPSEAPATAQAARSSVAPVASQRRTRPSRAEGEAPRAPAAPIPVQPAPAPAPPTADEASSLSPTVVEAVLRERFEAEDLGDDIMLEVSCDTPPRCLATLSGPQLQSGTSAQLAEALSESTGQKYRAAATVFSHVEAESPDPTHATFVSFYPADAPRSEAQDDVRRALGAFKDDLKSDDSP